MGVAASRRADLARHRRHLPAQLFQLLSTVELRLLGGEDCRHHLLLRYGCYY